MPVELIQGDVILLLLVLLLVVVLWVEIPFSPIILFESAVVTIVVTWILLITSQHLWIRREALDQFYQLTYFVTPRSVLVAIEWFVFIFGLSMLLVGFKWAFVTHSSVYMHDGLFWNNGLPKI